jgi:hypothetical protein
MQSPLEFSISKYSAAHDFWPVEFSNGRLGKSHNAATYLIYLFVSVSISTVDLVTPKLQENKHPPLPSQAR